MATMTLLVSNEDVLASVSIADCIERIEQVYRAAGHREAAWHPRSVFWSPLEDGQRHALAALQGVGLREQVAVIRVRSDVYRTVRTGDLEHDEKFAGRPGLYCGLLLLFSVTSGDLIGFVNDGVIQQMRVASTAVVAARRLADPDASVMAIIGSGNQARWHATAFAHAFQLREIRMFSPNVARLRATTEQLRSDLGIDVVPAASAAAALDGVAILSTCTNSLAPVLDARDIPDDCFVSSVRHKAEMDPAILDRTDVVFVNEPAESDEIALGSEEDQRASSIPALAGVKRRERPTLVELVAGTVPAPPLKGIRYFLNNQGLGIQFVAVGALALERAREQGLGRELPSEWFLQDTPS
jgi:alanine dehydrogenase